MRVAVLCHSRGPGLFTERYYMADVGRLLRADGVDVVEVRGIRDDVQADVAVLHVDLTRVPDEYRDYLKRFPVVVNGALFDISKRFVSTQLVSRGDGWEGPVIVKANRNCGGIPEARIEKRGRLPRCRPFRDYVVLQSVADVPDDVWADPSRVVEKFKPERVAGDGYRLRMWKFCGDAETVTFAYSHDPIVKGRKTHRREEVAPDVPQELREARARLGADFGKIDYAVSGGEVVLYDVNRTPTITRPIDEELPRLRAFADALRAMAERVAA
jgi:hypothetical protein